MGPSPDMQRTKCTRGQERGCICPLPSFPHKQVPFLVSHPTSTRKNNRGILVQVMLFFFFFSLDREICLKHWTLDMWVSVGWCRAGLYQWLCLLLLCFLIQTSAALCVWSSWRLNENRGLPVENLYDLLPKTFEVSNFRNSFSVSLTSFCFFSAQGGRMLGFLLQSLIAQSPSESRPAIVSRVWWSGEKKHFSLPLQQWSRGQEAPCKGRWSHQRGPCVLQLWRSTVGPSFGWVLLNLNEMGDYITWTHYNWYTVELSSCKIILGLVWIISLLCSVQVNSNWVNTWNHSSRG